MYVPPAFAADDETALAMLARASFGALVTSGPDGLMATQLPFLIENEPLRAIGHVARANPIWRSGGGEGLLIVQGPNAYVSPGFYPSKQDHGRVVPTWNYEAVHVRGALSFFEDGNRLLKIVEDLTTRFEHERDHPWAVSDAPADYIDKMVRAIVGVELRITSIEAARKLSQNRSESDRGGVLTGLSSSVEAGDRAVAAAMRHD
jgi:transcriptional regulator